MTASKLADLGQFTPLQKIALVKGLLSFRASVLMTHGERRDAEMLGGWSDILAEALKDIGWADSKEAGQVKE